MVLPPWAMKKYARCSIEPFLEANGSSSSGLLLFFGECIYENSKIDTFTICPWAIRLRLVVGPHEMRAGAGAELMTFHDASLMRVASPKMVGTALWWKWTMSHKMTTKANDDEPKHLFVVPGSLSFDRLFLTENFGEQNWQRWRRVENVTHIRFRV